MHNFHNLNSTNTMAKNQNQPKLLASSAFSFSRVERRGFRPTQAILIVRRTLSIVPAYEMDFSFCRDSFIRDYIPFRDTLFPEGVIILLVRYFCPFINTPGSQREGPVYLVCNLIQTISRPNGSLHNNIRVVYFLSFHPTSSIRYFFCQYFA